MAKKEPIKLEDNAKKSSLKHKIKIVKSGEKNSDKANQEATKQVMFKTAEENYEFNTKTKIPEGKKIEYIDGNKENIKFSNLKLV